MGLQRKDLLAIEELSAEEILLILDTALSFKEVVQRPIKKVPALRGKTVVNLFFENSTRTRTSFELAAKRLSADVVNFAASTSSLAKGETLLDTVRNIEAMNVHTIIMRHSCSGSVRLVAGAVKASVVNAGDGTHEHPTQGLLDMFTIREHLEKGERRKTKDAKDPAALFKGLHVAIVGDIANSRVARSDIHGLCKLGARITLVGRPVALAILEGSAWADDAVVDTTRGANVFAAAQVAAGEKAGRNVVTMLCDRGEPYLDESGFIE